MILTISLLPLQLCSRRQLKIETNRIVSTFVEFIKIEKLSPLVNDLLPLAMRRRHFWASCCNKSFWIEILKSRRRRQTSMERLMSLPLSIIKITLLNFNCDLSFPCTSHRTINKEEKMIPHDYTCDERNQRHYMREINKFSAILGPRSETDEVEGWRIDAVCVAANNGDGETRLITLKRS